MAGLPDVLPWIDAKKHQALAELTTALQAPETLGPNIWGALRDFAQNLGLAKTEEQKQRDEDLKSIMFRGSPEGKAAQRAKIAEAMMGFGEGGIGGILRGGGRNALMASHASPVDGLIKWVPSGPKSVRPDHVISQLKAPSFAITGHESLTNPYKGGGAVIIPKVGALDPTHGNTALYNRDAWTRRIEDLPTSSWGRPEYRAQQRLAAWMDPKATERLYPLGKEILSDMGTDPFGLDTAHLLSILQSPKFRSFKHYEESPEGANTLYDQSTHTSRVKALERASKLDAFISAWLKSQPEGHIYKDDSAGTLNLLLQRAREGDVDAQIAIQEAKRLPSEYGELKSAGPVGLAPDQLAGAILSGAEPYTPYVQKALKERGLRTEIVSPNIASDQLFDIARWLQDKVPLWGGK